MNCLIRRRFKLSGVVFHGTRDGAVRIPLLSKFDETGDELVVHSLTCLTHRPSAPFVTLANDVKSLSCNSCSFKYKRPVNAVVRKGYKSSCYYLTLEGKSILSSPKRNFVKSHHSYKYHKSQAGIGLEHLGLDTEPKITQLCDQKSCNEEIREVTPIWTMPEGYDTGIKIFNSLTKRKEPLILPRGRLVTWYAIKFQMLFISNLVNMDQNNLF